jgi:hypothetical protein
MHRLLQHVLSSSNYIISTCSFPEVVRDTGIYDTRQDNLIIWHAKTVDNQDCIVASYCGCLRWMETNIVHIVYHSTVDI